MMRIFSLAFFLLFWSACVPSNQDMEPPKIQIQSSDPPVVSAELCGAISDQVLMVRDTQPVILQFLFEDNIAVQEVKMDLHQNFDCHGHSSQAPGFSVPDIEQATTDWSLLEILTYEDQATIEQELALAAPANVTAGNYHLGIRAIDIEGNESDQVIFDLAVMNPGDTSDPTLEVLDPQEKEFTASKGTNLRFSGSLQDDQPLGQGGNAVVYLTYRKKGNSSIFSGPFEVVPAGHGTEFSFDLNFEIPTTLTTGEYIVNIQAADGVRNLATPIDFSLSVVN